MKILYAAMRNDPRDLDGSSSVDYGFYTTFLAEGHEVDLVGPFPARPVLAERAVKRLHDRLTQQRYLKWDVTSMWRAGRAITGRAAASGPDVIFTMFPATVVFYRGSVPFVFNTDLTFGSWQEHGAGFSRPALWLLHRLERRVLRRSQQVILHSDWSRQDIARRHGLGDDRLHVVPMPAAIPVHAVPKTIDIRRDKKLESPLRLLLVGKDFKRKGVDIAIEVVRRLNEKGQPAHLTVCATAGPPAPYLRYVGPFRKSDPSGLSQYITLYRQAHLLLHPARFEPAGIVPGEAAAFATPTVTNNAGGLGTTVQDGVSGIVLPRHSGPEAYVTAIADLARDAERYYALCNSARQRYERTLNWPVIGPQLTEILAAAAS